MLGSKGTKKLFEFHSTVALVRTFLPVLERLDAVEHATVESSNVAREEGNHEHHVQLDKVRNLPP